ncbi:MAG: double zinc ribbon domain-containing protein [Eubacteriales bacterium]
MLLAPIFFLFLIIVPILIIASLIQGTARSSLNLFSNRSPSNHCGDNHSIYTSKCRHCNAVVNANFKYCPHCQTALQKECNRCGTLLNSDWLYC